MGEDNHRNEEPELSIIHDEIIAPLAPQKSRNIKDWLVLIAGLGAPLMAALSAYGSGWQLWKWESGFSGVKYAFFIALGAVLFGLLWGWMGKRKGVHDNRLLRWTGMAVALAFIGWMGSYIIKARSVPAIHDISTDLADPPAFRILALRPDNLDKIPGDDDAEMKGMNPQQRWVVLHQKEYGDIRSVRIGMPVGEVMAKAERLAKGRGWTIALISPDEGRLEATETSAMFGFKDDIVLRARATEDNSGSIVDMRSVSRVGQSDLGVNAKRVRSFLADLSGTVTAE